MDFLEKVNIVKRVQAKLDLEADGIDGKLTWAAIEKTICGEAASPIVQPPSPPQIPQSVSKKAYDLIIKYEVGGEADFNASLKHPTYPGAASGVTIGIGYDLGYNNFEQFTADWKSLLPAGDFARLAQQLGKIGTTVYNMIPNLHDITITWEEALIVFTKSTIPRFIKETLRAFPGADTLHPDCFGALVSVVFNRGSSITGPSRIEMLNIRNLIASKDYNAIANEVLSMCRLWKNRGLDGLLVRRKEEAALIKSCAN